jgi:thioredoxin reductase
VRMSEQQRAFDVVIVGGGAAGLSAALVLGRARRQVLVVDAGDPRNATAEHMHGYLSRDGLPPSELLALGREEVRRYGVQLWQSTVVGVDRGDAGWSVAMMDGVEVAARHVMVATGLVDALPDVPGVVESWGKDVLHCPYCHGWEVRDQPLCVLATEPQAVLKALTVSRWSDDVTMLMHGFGSDDLSADDRRRLAAVGIEAVAGPVERLDISDGRLTGVALSEGRVVPCAAVFVEPDLEPRDDLLRLAGAEIEQTPQGDFVKTDADGHTSVAGLWAVGNVGNATEQVITAAAAGHRSAVALSSELIIEDVDAAVSPTGR